MLSPFVSSVSDCAFAEADHSRSPGTCSVAGSLRPRSILWPAYASSKREQ